jgi:hypothetical protein
MQVARMDGLIRKSHMDKARASFRHALNYVHVPEPGAYELGRRRRKCLASAAARRAELGREGALLRLGFAFI